MSRLFALILALLPLPAQADVAEVVGDRILPAHDRFAESTARLARLAQDSCAPATLSPAFHAAYDDWMALQHLHLGPAQDEGRGLAIAFWPDPKGMGRRAQQALIGGDPTRLQPEAFAQQSVAARGLTGLERLLFGDIAWPGDTCPLIRATASDLARLAAELQAGWMGGFADLLLQAGAPDNSLFLSQAEARQAVFTLIVSGLEQISDQRLGRPLGSFDRPAPEQAEARASGRSLRNVTLALQAIRDTTASLTAGAPQTLAALDRALGLARDLDDPVLAGTATPQGRLRVEILQQAVDQARVTAQAELGAALGVGMGFNAMDGD